MTSNRRVAFLTNMIPPYHKALYLLLSARFTHFRFFISTAMEPNRPWLPEWSGLDVVPQKGFTFRRTWRHPSGFQEPVSVHFPLDTFSQLAAFKPDVIVSVEMGFRTALALAYARFHPPCRLLLWSEVTPLTESGRGLIRHLFRRLLIPRVDAFLALGPGGVRYLQSLGAAPSQTFKITYSTSLPEFLALPIERHGSTATRLFFSGQLIERKGLVPFVETLAKWAAQNPDRNVEFSLLGHGPVLPALQALPLPPNAKLLFIGTLQYNQLPAAYADAGIFVLPTLADTWAVVVNEAMASGLPVLGSLYSQAVEEMVEEGRTGWTFHPDNAAEMYSALDRALTCSVVDLNRMRISARKRALEVTPENSAAVFERAVGQGSA